MGKLVGSDGSLKTWTEGAEETGAAHAALVVGDAIIITELDSASPPAAWGDLVVGDYYISPVAVAMNAISGAANKFKKLSFTELAALLSYDVNFEQPTIDTSTIDDEEGTNRFGRPTFTGSISGVSRVEIPTIWSRAIDYIKISAAGVAAKTSRTTSVYPLAFFFADAVDDEGTLVLMGPRAQVGGLTLGITDGSRQEWSANVSKAAGAASQLIEVAAA